MIVSKLNNILKTLMRKKMGILLNNDIVKHYSNYQVDELSYATVRDFCDSMDFLKNLTILNNDLKDVQRPWILKAIVRTVPVGSKLLEIGAGDPHVANLLSQLGYDVTVVDPYDGTGNGPKEYKELSRQFPNITIIRDFFTTETKGIDVDSFDCVYSISVLEHVPDSDLIELFKAVRKFGKSAKVKSIHAIDHVMQGDGAESHLAKLKLMLRESGLSVSELDEMLGRLKDDVETYFLSAEAHNMWRGSMSYDDFPMRRCVSIQLCS
jgi:2-polyprenyl-3-methyl-5-hydroxy-6-metoxy-1,4-benzoquinol methylase